MKNKINFKLTFCLVSLFIGFLFLIFGNKNTYCVSFGLIFLAVGLILYLADRFQKLQKSLIEVSEALEDAQVEEVEHIFELTELKKNLKKQKNFTCVICAVFAFLLIVVAIINLF